MEGEECWVYRMYSGMELVYVGISDSPSSRMANHEATKWWWFLVDSVSWHKCDTRAEAKDSESHCITISHPIMNRSESSLRGADRLTQIVGLLWGHEFNITEAVECPFCRSRGDRYFVKSHNDPRIVRRSDGLVVAFTAECEKHFVDFGISCVQWKHHERIADFLRSFPIPATEVDRLVAEAQDGSFEDDDGCNLAQLLEGMSEFSLESIKGPHARSMFADPDAFTEEKRSEGSDVR